jgi:DNA-binding response OmpR family regulator
MTRSDAGSDVRVVQELEFSPGGYQRGYPSASERFMERATFLIIEPEQEEGLSSRKLLLETAKHNVLTAYSSKEGLEIFGKHPVDAVVVHASVDDIPCGKVVERIKKERKDVPVIVISPTGLDQCKPADMTIGSHKPEELLNALEELTNAAEKTRRVG